MKEKISEDVEELYNKVVPEEFKAELEIVKREEQRKRKTYFKKRTLRYKKGFSYTWKRLGNTIRCGDYGLNKHITVSCFVRYDGKVEIRYCGKMLK